MCRAPISRDGKGHAPSTIHIFFGRIYDDCIPLCPAILSIPILFLYNLMIEHGGSVILNFDVFLEKGTDRLSVKTNLIDHPNLTNITCPQLSVALPKGIDKGSVVNDECGSNEWRRNLGDLAQLQCCQITDHLKITLLER